MNWVAYICIPLENTQIRMAKTKKSSTKNKVTPLMQQYHTLKAKYPDAILLFRVGDFYETFGEDAVKTAQVLGIVLTARNNGGSNIELAGFPYHSLDTYLPKLVKAGFRVAIGEQLEKPSKEKKIVKRGVVEMVTPGITTDNKLLDQRKNNYFASLHFGKKDCYGLALIDISTGEFLAYEGNEANIIKLLNSFNPKEVVFARKHQDYFSEVFSDQYYTFLLDEWIFTPEMTVDRLKEHFKVNSLKGFGIDNMPDAQIAAGAALYYLNATENKQIQHISTINRIHLDDMVWLDHFTIRNLELLYPTNHDGIALIDVLDNTQTPMGSRLLKKWVALPLRNMATVNRRLEVVKYFYDNENTGDEISFYVKKIGDLERLVSKIPSEKINPRELIQIRFALEAISPLKELLSATKHSRLDALQDSMNTCQQLLDKITNEILLDAPLQLNKGMIIAEGVSEELDEYRNLINNSKQILADIQVRESEATGIDKLKIGFNNVFGYYLEVTNKYKDKGLVPDNWIRKQTLSNSERYITEELKVLETKILSAEEKILDLETGLYRELVHFSAEYIGAIQLNAQIIAQLDILLTFARNAKKQNYCLPEMNEGYAIDIKMGRHPVIEQQLPHDTPFIANDVMLDNENQQVLMITGPNMAGKSALLRQTALICLMAQMGSFVPAQSAKLGMIDRVFTRVGASDNISSGESTFMVEMNETATIMNNINDRSLVLLDEIGRGTSTYDGISIAWSIAEFLHSNNIARPKTLFATHYHELNELAERFDRVQNFHISTKKVGKKVIFLRKLTPGGSNHSFGIYVAKMAGMPKNIVDRSEEILKTLEQKFKNTNPNESEKSLKEKVSSIPTAPVQLSFFEYGDPETRKVLEEIKVLDMDGMTPIDCMMKLNEFKELLKE